jgi:formate dehydrogenase subunit gamma
MTPEQPADASPRKSSGEAPAPSQILRFQAGERLLHWALAAPFVLLYTTAALLMVFYGEPHPRPFREAFALAHRVFGVMLIALPPLALLAGAKDWRVHLENLREGWIWRRDDFRWLVLFPKNAMNPKIELPEQGKFNAAEKLNFMMVSTFYPLYVFTGVLVWLPGVEFTAYLAHFAMAVLGLPLVGGHIFMATINPETRVGLSGMFTGWVDRSWAKHHYTRWYREHFEPSGLVLGLAERLKLPARVHCGSCEDVQVYDSWMSLIERSFRVEPLVCPTCASPIRLVPPGDEGRAAEVVLEHLRSNGANEAFDPDGGDAA